MLAAAVLWAAPPAVHAGEPAGAAARESGPIREVLYGGNLDFYLRYRFEFVDDAQNGSSLKNAYANTVRTALGYRTGLLHGFGGYLQIEDVRAIGRERFNDGGSNGVADRAVVADPEGVEINQAYLRFENLPHSAIRLGRQEIEHRQAPLHRFVGNILWRQNWQGYDAFRATTTVIPDTSMDYSYVWNVNRVFGERNPIPDHSNFRMDSHLFNVGYSGFDIARIDAYAYLLDFESNLSERFSTRTFGLRLEGSHALTPRLRALYTGEYARQADYAKNTNEIGIDYWLGEAGVTRQFGGLVETVTAKLSYEVLSGNGGVDSFQTPLGTNHPFQGWADRFLVTPGDGVCDLFLTLRATVGGAAVAAVYHDFSSDHDGYDYGSEWNLQLEKPFLRHYSAGVKYARYDADRNAFNTSRNSASGQAFDVEKLWFWVQASF